MHSHGSAGAQRPHWEVKKRFDCFNRASELVLTIRKIERNAQIVPVNLATLPKDISSGDTVLLDDGALQLKVLKRAQRI